MWSSRGRRSRHFRSFHEAVGWDDGPAGPSLARAWSSHPGPGAKFSVDATRGVLHQRITAMGVPHSFARRRAVERVEAADVVDLLGDG